MTMQSFADRPGDDHMRTDFFVQWFVGHRDEERGLAPIPVPDGDCACLAVEHMPGTIARGLAFRVDRNHPLGPSRTILATRDRTGLGASGSVRPIPRPRPVAARLRRVRDLSVVPVAALAFGVVALTVFCSPKMLLPQPAPVEPPQVVAAASPIFREVRVIPLTSIAFAEIAPPAQPAQLDPAPSVTPARSVEAAQAPAPRLADAATAAKPQPPRRPANPSRTSGRSRVAEAPRPPRRPIERDVPERGSVFARATDVVGRSLTLGGDVVQTALGGVRQAGGSIATLGHKVASLID